MCVCVCVCARVCVCVCARGPAHMHAHMHRHVSEYTRALNEARNQSVRHRFGPEILKQDLLNAELYVRKHL